MVGETKRIFCITRRFTKNFLKGKLIVRTQINLAIKKTSNAVLTERRMEESKGSRCLLVFIFWILVPSFDQFTDLNLVTRLLNGPDQDINITSCKINHFCEFEICNIIYHRQLLSIQSQTSRTSQRLGNWSPTELCESKIIEDIVFGTDNNVKAYEFIGYFTLTPILLSTFLTMIKCWSLGTQSGQVYLLYLKTVAQRRSQKAGNGF